jgi:hypothetical protein
MQKKMIFLTLITLLLAGCLPSAATPQDISAEVNTAVAQTMQSNTQIALMVEQTVRALQPAFTPTSIPTNTPEPTFEIITIEPDTPVPPSNTPTDEPVVQQPQVKQAYDCYVETRSPGYFEEIKAGGNFEIRWFVINTGTKTWDSGVDVKYASGPQMTSEKRVEISKALKPGDSFKITLNGTAPNKKGNHTMSWIVEGQLCYANVNITVK